MFSDSLMANPLANFNAETLFSSIPNTIELENESLVSDVVETLEETTISLTDKQENVEEISKKQMLKKTKLKRFKSNKKVEVIKRTSAERAAKSHKELSDMISSLYNNLPSTFILHESFVKITKIQKLDQIQNFMFNVKQHGYSPNK